MCIMTYVRCVGEENNDKWETILGHGGVSEVIFDKWFIDLRRKHDNAVPSELTLNET